MDEEIFHRSVATRREQDRLTARKTLFDLIVSLTLIQREYGNLRIKEALEGNRMLYKKKKKDSKIF